MTASETYKILLDLARKDKRGKSLMIDEFNELSPIVNEELAEQLYSKFEASQGNTDSLARLKVMNYEQTFTNGEGTLPTDYWHLTGEPRYAYSSVTWTGSVTGSGLTWDVASFSGTTFSGRATGDFAARTSSLYLTFTAVKDKSYSLNLDISTYTNVTAASVDISCDKADVTLLSDGTLSASEYTYYFMATSSGTAIITITMLAPNGVEMQFDADIKIRTYPTSWRRVDVITNLELTNRLTDELTVPTAKNPVVLIAEEDEYDSFDIFVWPESITSVRLDYLQTPATPYLDYYVNNTTYAITELADTDTLQTVPIGSTYRDGTAGTGIANTTSLTQDPDWDDSEMALWISIFLQKLGVQLDNQTLLQYGLLKEKEDE